MASWIAVLGPRFYSKAEVVCFGSSIADSKTRC
jgi:hypothetical protein